MFAPGGCTWVRPQAPSTVWLHPRSLSHAFPSKEKQEAWKSTQLLCLCVLQVFWACVPVGVWQGSQGPEALQLSESSWMEPQSGNQIWADRRERLRALWSSLSAQQSSGKFQPDDPSLLLYLPSHSSWSCMGHQQGENTVITTWYMPEMCWHLPVQSKEVSGEEKLLCDISWWVKSRISCSAYKDLSLCCSRDEGWATQKTNIKKCHITSAIETSYFWPYVVSLVIHLKAYH